MQARAEAFEPEPERSRPARDDAPAAPAAASRALVPVCPVEPGPRRRDASRYPGAAFLAHLIAVDRRLPQTRPRGRASPADAAAVYGATLKGAPARTGRRLRRSA